MADTVKRLYGLLRTFIFVTNSRMDSSEVHYKLREFEVFPQVP